MHVRQPVACRSRREPGFAGHVKGAHSSPDNGRGHLQMNGGYSCRRLVQTVVVMLGLIVPGSLGIVTHAAPPTIQDPPLAPPLEETDSYMGVHIGSRVRVKCTAPAIELNNATLVAITPTTITVASANGDRFHLPKETTVIESPVDWQRTTSITDNQQPAPRSKHSSWGWVVFLLLPAGAAAAGWFWLARRRATEEESQPFKPLKSSTGGRPASPGSGRLVLTAAPAPSPDPEAPVKTAQPVSDNIDALVESRCYGTAIERLEEQIKTKPREFALRLQLLNVYAIIGNRKQVDRVLHQIEFHPDFTAEEKLKARQSIAASKDKSGKPAPLPAAPGQPAPAVAHQPSAG
jgi:hypothetical protein